MNSLCWEKKNTARLKFRFSVNDMAHLDILMLDNWFIFIML